MSNSAHVRQLVRRLVIRVENASGVCDEDGLADVRAATRLDSELRWISALPYNPDGPTLRELVLHSSMHHGAPSLQTQRVLQDIMARFNALICISKIAIYGSIWRPVLQQEFLWRLVSLEELRVSAHDLDVVMDADRLVFPANLQTLVISGHMCAQSLAHVLGRASLLKTLRSIEVHIATRSRDDDPHTLSAELVTALYQCTWPTLASFSLTMGDARLRRHSTCFDHHATLIGAILRGSSVLSSLQVDVNLLLNILLRDASTTHDPRLAVPPPSPRLDVHRDSPAISLNLTVVDSLANIHHLDLRRPASAIFMSPSFSVDKEACTPLVLATLLGYLGAPSHSLSLHSSSQSIRPPNLRCITLHNLNRVVSHVRMSLVLDILSNAGVQVEISAVSGAAPMSC